MSGLIIIACRIRDLHNDLVSGGMSTAILWLKGKRRSVVMVGGGCLAISQVFFSLVSFSSPF